MQEFFVLVFAILNHTEGLKLFVSVSDLPMTCMEFKVSSLFPFFCSEERGEALFVLFGSTNFKGKKNIIHIFENLVM